MARGLDSEALHRNGQGKHYSVLPGGPPGKSRTAQKIVYSADGKRKRQIPPCRIFTRFEGYESCLFGEHQLLHAPNDAIIALVESEKTVALAIYYYPMVEGKPVLWMASLGSHGMTADKIQSLAGRQVLLIPDFSYVARAVWGTLSMRKMDGKPHPTGELEADYLSTRDNLKNAGCQVSVLDPFPEENYGSDLADHIVRELLKGAEPLVTEWSLTHNYIHSDGYPSDWEI